ncbi:MAG: hypothetical protein HC828_02435 [Blastochloris sp.]|nr:hypothetical protein [Blastochloris sp.]
MGGFRSLAERLRPRPDQGPQAEPTAAPLRSDLLSATQLDAHARTLAAEHRDAAPRLGIGDPLRAALGRDQRRLTAVYQILGEDIRQRIPLSPAAEWLLDNFHVVSDQIRAIKHDLPRGYYRQLPKLRRGSLAGLPRVYAIALELIAHSDGRVDAATSLRFLNAYQSVTPLQMGELWAVAIMLRIALVRRLSLLASQVLQVRELRLEADAWAERILGAPGEEVDEAAVLRDLTRRYPTLPLTLAAQLLRRLRAHEGEHDIGRVVSWLETQPVTPHETVEALVHEEHQRQSANQVAVGNSIGSMRALGAITWPDWFEKVSQVEQLLRRDPGAAYAISTFATRDRYRHAVEELARSARLDENEVARRLLARAEAAPSHDLRLRHIGYYLVDKGRAAFEAELRARPSPVVLARRAALEHPTTIYLGAIGGATAFSRQRVASIGRPSLAVGSKIT